MREIETIEQRYERDFGEPWAELEKRVLARHPYCADLLKKCDEEMENFRIRKQKKWWQIWK